MLFSKVSENDAVMAILLYEESITARVGMLLSLLLTLCKKSGLLGCNITCELTEERH